MLSIFGSKEELKMSPKALLGGNNVLALILHGLGESLVKHLGRFARHRRGDASHYTSMKPKRAKKKKQLFHFECDNKDRHIATIQSLLLLLFLNEPHLSNRTQILDGLY